jgi:rhodanese-related sulfurtransferase
VGGIGKEATAGSGFEVRKTTDSRNGYKNVQAPVVLPIGASKNHIAPVENSGEQINVPVAEQGFRVRRNTQQTKGFNMQTNMNRIHDPAKARAYFEQKLAFTTGPVEFDRWIKTGEDNLVLVDVREAEDFSKGHIPGAINIPKENWDSPEGLSKDKTNVVYCYSQQCHLAANACVRFAAAGYPVMELEGGFGAWKKHELDIEEESAPRFKSSTQPLGSRR